MYTPQERRPYENPIRSHPDRNHEAEEPHLHGPDGNHRRGGRCLLQRGHRLLRGARQGRCRPHHHRCQRGDQQVRAAPLHRAFRLPSRRAPQHAHRQVPPLWRQGVRAALAGSGTPAVHRPLHPALLRRLGGLLLVPRPHHQAVRGRGHPLPHRAHGLLLEPCR